MLPPALAAEPTLADPAAALAGSDREPKLYFLKQ